ncbi:Hyphally regulated cell wall protein N-terminal-domain-containing protein [Scheffersomyces amazonensis]|uniref:Hyphally regulated cell wall protein N-terminal-domain-containing protein n=1 Tax=Scheffersomyces amazonensis TaxID=1078765 RepID=UPI00315D5BF1
MKLGILSIICACYLLRESMGALSLSENLDVTTDSHLTNNDFGEDDMVYFNADITIDSGVSLILDVYTFNLAGNFLNRGYTYIRNFYSLPENYNENRNALYLNFNTDPTSLYDFSNYGTLIVTDNDTSCVAPMYKIGGQTFYNEGNILFADGGICNYANFGLLSLSVINTGVISFFLNEGQLMGLAYLGDAGTTNEVINNGTICMRGGTSSQQSILNANSPISGNGCINVGSSSVFQLTTPDTFGTDGNQMTIFLSSETSVFYISSAIVGAYSFLVKGWGNGNFIADSDFSNSEWTYVGDTLSVAFNNAVVNYIVGYGYDSSLISMEQIDNYGYGLTYAGPPPDSSTPDTCQTCPSVLPQVGEPFIVSDDDDNDEIVTSSSEPSSLTDSSTVPSVIVLASNHRWSQTVPSVIVLASNHRWSQTVPSVIVPASNHRWSQTVPSMRVPASNHRWSQTVPSMRVLASNHRWSQTVPSMRVLASNHRWSQTVPSVIVPASNHRWSQTVPSMRVPASNHRWSQTVPSMRLPASNHRWSQTVPSVIVPASNHRWSQTVPSVIVPASNHRWSQTVPSMRLPVQKKIYH